MRSTSDNQSRWPASMCALPERCACDGCCRAAGLPTIDETTERSDPMAESRAPAALHPPCANCQQRLGTEIWAGDGGLMGYIHGAYAMWCEVCVVESQLEHARIVAATIPELEQKLLVLRGAS